MTKQEDVSSRQHRCPECGASCVDRDIRAGWERWIPRIVPTRPYRCRNCRRRFLDRPLLERR